MIEKLKLPKNSFQGLKIYCNLCKKDNASCRHYDRQCFRMRVHIAGTKNGVKCKTLQSREYLDALKEAVAFKEAVTSGTYDLSNEESRNNNYSLSSAILKYNQYLKGNHEYTHLRKTVSVAHQKECIRFCLYFAETVKDRKDITTMPVVNTNQTDVATFYQCAERKYGSKAFNKSMAALRAFYTFLIDVEKVKMENPFAVYVTKKSNSRIIQTLNKTEFESILNAIEEYNPIKVYGKEKKDMYEPYLKDAFKLFLLTGGRRKEVISLRWSNILISMDGVKFFVSANYKVIKQKESLNKDSQNVKPKYFPINRDLQDLLDELGYNEKKDTNDYILFPERNIKNKTLIDKISKSFTHYRVGAGIEKNVSLMNLRKTYLSWVNAILNKDTRVISSHASHRVLEDNYLDKTILSAIEKTAIELRIFGT